MKSNAKIGMLLRQLHDAETDLAAELREVAQAVRDHDLLDQVSLLHKQTLTQIKWLKTRIREATPQVLCTG